MPEFVVVFLGAGLGGMARHGVGVAALKSLGSAFPFATLIVNIVGSVVMGLLVGAFVARGDPGQSWRLFLTTGFLGGFTTFSTFSLDTALMIERGQWALAAAYVLMSVIIALLGLFAGLYAMRQFG